MCKCWIDLRGQLPITRERAARIASAASRFHATLTLERDGIILNLKSMIGLLSQSFPKDGQMELVADGADEDAACEALARELNGQTEG